MILTMAAVAAAKGFDPGPISVDVRMLAAHDPDNEGGVRFESEIHLSERLSAREQRILFNSARSCEVHHLLRGPAHFEETLRLT